MRTQTPAPIRKIAFLADYLPRKCGIATFTADLRCAMAAEFPAMQCLVVPVNDLASGYDYPEEVRFEIAEQDLPRDSCAPRPARYAPNRRSPTLAGS